MVHGGIHGPAGAPRPLANCNQQVIIVLEGRGDNIDEASIEDKIESELPFDVSVNSRGARIDGDQELVVTIRSSTVSEDTVETIESTVRNHLITENSGFDVLNWRVEGT